MPIVRLEGCTATPFGSYLKALGVLRLVSEQADSEARASWDGDTLVLETNLSKEALIAFFRDEYCPTPIVAPWNGGSGFYAKDNKEGVNAIAQSTSERFAEYRSVIAACQTMQLVLQGKFEKDAQAEDERRTGILLECRNELPDRTVEWLDAAVGISAEGGRAFAPVLGTGGNEGRLDYTNNFMSRLGSLLLSPKSKTSVRELLESSLFGTRTEALESAAAAGQYDPGRAGGANQGEGISADVATNLWDFVLAMEGAVAWASGIYRRQGISYRSFLCSPFTVKATAVGYGSASQADDARAEIWAPIWDRKVTYAELRVLLREGRASVAGKAAETGLEFAEAATSLGVDRSITRFVRYSLLKRRGDSYVALPAGSFAASYRGESDRIRQLQNLLASVERFGIPPGCESIRRQVDAAFYEALLRGGQERVREALASVGRLVRAMVTKTEVEFPKPHLRGKEWVEACGRDCVEVRIAAGLASLYDEEAGSLRVNLTRSSREFAWEGSGLASKLLAVLERRLLKYSYGERSQPFNSAINLRAGDATLFIENATRDELIEDLLFAFACMRWQGKQRLQERLARPLPVYAALKLLFLPHRVIVEGEPKWLRADPRILAFLRRGDIRDAMDIAIHKLEVAGLKPVRGSYAGGLDSARLAAALLIPTRGLRQAIVHNEPKTNVTGA